MSLSVKLEAFDGPLDLLLHLIEKNKIDIFDIPIVEITEQYRDYVSKMEKKDMENAAILYDEIDRNKLFRGTVAAEDRSIMNVCFVMNDEYKELEDEFSKFAAAAGMVGIKGHRSVGGFRASLYNAMPKSSVEALVACMKDFEKQH